MSEHLAAGYLAMTEGSSMRDEFVKIVILHRDENYNDITLQFFWHRIKRELKYQANLDSFQ